MTIKDSYDVVGLPSTWGLDSHKDNYPSENAVAVDRLLAAGLIIFAKTNVPPLLADWQTFNPLYGTTNNPWDPARSPGGSSGGSAAALAAGLTPLEAGSDIGASIRSPAHYCGVYGHKPTQGIVPTRGQAGPGRVAPVDFFVSGPMARSAADLAAALPIMAGPDVLDAPGWNLMLPKPAKRRLSEFRVAVMTSNRNCDVDREVQDLLQALADFLARQGASVSDRALPDIDMDAAHATYIRLLRSATARRHSPEVFARQLEAARTLPGGDDSYFARMVRANTISHRDWLDADEDRERFRYKWAEFFRDYDLLLCPAAATAAFPHDQGAELYQRSITINGQSIPFTDQFFWAGISTLANLPATVGPIGLTPRGLPVGVQIVGPAFGDLACIGFAGLIEKDYFAFTPPPGYGD